MKLTAAQPYNWQESIELAGAWVTGVERAQPLNWQEPNRVWQKHMCTLLICLKDIKGFQMSLNPSTDLYKFSGLLIIRQ